MSRHLRSSRRITVPRVAAVFLISIVGCHEPEIESYVVDAETEKVYSSELLRDEFQPIPFEWETPGEWQLAENDRFSTVAWETESKQGTIRITVSELSGELDISPQVQRWQGQVEDTKDVTEVMEEIKLKSGEPATYIDIAGSTGTILGLMTKVNEGLWFFKLRGPRNVENEQRKRFRDFCQSLSVPQ